MNKDKIIKIKEPNEDAIIWKYIPEFSELLTILENKLFYCRADLFQDKFEGTLPKIIIEKEYEFNKYQEHEARKLGFQWKYSPEQQREDENERNKNLKKNFFVNCWFLGEKENLNMWKIYANLQTGFVIKSTYKQLKDSIIYEIEDQKEAIYFGKVEYIDYNTADIDFNNSSELYFYKNKGYVFEDEIRSVINLYAWNFNNKYSESNVGISVTINSNKLIQEIIAAPEMPENIYNEIANLIKKNYNIDVKQSEILGHGYY